MSQLLEKISSLGTRLRRYQEHPQLWTFKRRNLLNRLEIMRKWGNGRAFLPEAVHFCPTYRCNLDCQTCGVDLSAFHNAFVAEDEARMLYGELDWPDLRRVVDNYAQVSPVVSLCGGEPFMYPHMQQFMEYNLRDKGLYMQCTTHGAFLRRDAGYLVEYGLPELYVSMDGVGDVYEANRGKGTWRGFTAGLDALFAAKENAGSRLPELAFIFTVYPGNQDRIVETWEYAQSLGVRKFLLHHLVIIPHETVEEHNRSIEDVMFRGIWRWAEKVEPHVADFDFDLILAQIEEVKHRTAATPGAEFHCVPELDKRSLEEFYLTKGFSGDEKNPCSIFWKALYIMPSGQVHAHHLCCYYPLGNLLTDDLRTIWNGEGYQKIRRFQQRGEPMPLCRRCFGFYGAYKR